MDQLLTQILANVHYDENASGHGLSIFCCKFGLKYDQPLVRFRWLDPQHYWHGISDLTITLSDFNQLNPTIDAVYITENKINGLSFPLLESAIVVFGLGYGIETLVNVAWLKDKRVFYWGDIDTDGFRILNRVRSFLPHTESILMDESTIQTSKLFWGKEPGNKRFDTTLPNLNEQEQQVYQKLLVHGFSRNFRLEQERVPLAYVSAVLTEDANKNI